MQTHLPFPLRRTAALLMPSLLMACASMSPGKPSVSLETAVHGQPIAGATCAVTIGSTRWDVKTPAVLAIGDARGELHIVCEKPGFRTSELIFRPETGAAGGASAGFGTGGYGSGIGLSLSFPLGGATAHYPKRLVVDLNPA